MHPNHAPRFTVSWLTVLALIVALLPAPAPAAAAGTISLTAIGTPYTENFDTLANSGSSSTVPNGWDFSETGTNANTLYSAGTGSSNTGDTYSFGAAGSNERAFGGLLSGSLVPTIGASFINNTGITITSLAVAYTGEEWRCGTMGRTDEIQFEYSLDATSLTTGTWIGVTSLFFQTPDTTSTGAKDGNAAGFRTFRNATISGLAIANGATFWIRWVDFNASGADDGLAVDDFALTPLASGMDTAPSVASTIPANGAVNVPPNANLRVTFSEDVNVAGDWYTISCAASGAHTAAVSGGPQVFTLDPQTDFSQGETCTVTILAALVSDQDSNDPPDNMAADYAFSFRVVGTLTPIRAIQGAGHTSPLVGQTIEATVGVVTALRPTGFYLQDPDPDSDPATSEGIFVYTSSAPTVAVGDLLYVGGTIQEYRQSSSISPNPNLTLTELSNPGLTFQLISSGNPLPEPVVIGAGGRMPPNIVIEDDASDVETTGVFDPAADGIDFYESLEGMYVQVNDAVAVSSTVDYSTNREIAVVGDGGAGSGLRTARGGLLAQPGDYNPERIILNDWITGGPTLPAANTGDSFPGAILGVMDYSYSNFKLQVTSLPALASAGLAREVAARAGLHQLSIATLNTENLDALDAQSRFDQLAVLIVTNLGSPDLLALEEIQDNNGAADDGTVAADQTYARLIAAIQAAGGPTYTFRQIDPVDNQDGGEPGGNIRVGFLFRTDTGLSFIDRPGAGSTTANEVVSGANGPELRYSPGRIDPTNAAFNASRKPLAAEFRYGGHHLFVIANHWNSKSTDQPLFGRYQPPTLNSEAQRSGQAQLVHDFVQAILTIDPHALVVVLGDLNDYEYSAPMATLTGSILTPLVSTLPQNERYSYIYNGNSQTLDHIVITNNMLSRLVWQFDIIHANAEFASRASDHDPALLRLVLPYYHLPIATR